jgi:hypothetical protein
VVCNYVTYFCFQENEKMQINPLLCIVLILMVMKVKGYLCMTSLLLMQRSMVWISLLVKIVLYIDLLCLGNWTRCIKFASISYPPSFIFLNQDPSHSCSPNLAVRLVVHDTPPNVYVSYTPSLLCLSHLLIRLGCLSLCSLH